MANLYQILNGPIDRLHPHRMHASMYGDYRVVERNARWSINYSRIGIDWNPTHKNMPKRRFKMAYDVVEPVDAREGLVTVVTTNGVPVNRTEWLEVAELMGRFVRVVMVDLFGMGDSSKPIEFVRPGTEEGDEKEWMWSWNLHAKIFKALFDDWRIDRPEWFVDGKLFFMANDWGAGAVQVFVDKYGPDYLLGAGLLNPIALNGYWVQQIGSLLPLALMPYMEDDPVTEGGKRLSPTFMLNAISFVGQATMLMETMFEQVSHNHNQYTLARFQQTWVDTMAYSDPRMNPSKTQYKFHAIRVLAEQAAHVLGNGELLPVDATENVGGLDIPNWDVPIKILWGKQDKMMPEGQVHRFANAVAIINEERWRAGTPSSLTLSYNVIQGAGHFLVSDQPEETADALLDWMRTVAGPHRLNNIFLGFDSLARQDELGTVIPGFRRTEAFSTRR